MVAMKIIVPLSMAEKSPCFYRHNNFEVNKQIHSPTPLHNLQALIINTSRETKALERGRKGAFVKNSH
jgi:hypothetical protein